MLDLFKDITSWPFFAAILAWAIAQALKPVKGLLKTGKWSWKKITSSGGFPSSHTSTVTALAFSIGMSDGNKGWTTVPFAIAATLAFIVMYDAINVRWHAGEHIQQTKRLIDDLKKQGIVTTESIEFNEGLKDVLGHKFHEIIGGAALGFLVAVAFVGILGKGF